MRLLHIVDTLDPKKGGVSQAVHTMSEEVSKVGLLNEVVTLDGEENSITNGLVQINRLGPTIGPWRYNKKLIPWLLSNFSRFDIIIVHGLWLYQTYAVKKAFETYIKQLKKVGKVGNVPALYIMPHGMLDPYFQRTPGRKIKAIRNWLYWNLIERDVINVADGLLFTCKEECLLAAIPFSGYQPKRELIIGLGVAEPPVFSKIMEEAFFDACPELRNQKYLLFLSRIDKKKGIDLLIKAYKRIIYEFGHRGVSVYENSTFCENNPERFEYTPDFPKLVIAGPGLNSEYGKKIAALVEDCPVLRNKVFFPGMLEGNQKWGAFYCAEAFVLPSHQENFGIAVVEALACSKPVLISNQVNIWSEIKEADAGIIADDSEAGTFKMLKTWIQMSESQRLRMEKQAKKCYEKHFELDAATSRLINALSYNINQPNYL
jgi:glycosyltransferase involved in cell wall biosynthesis